jgi:hypothetical protein
VVTWSVGEAVGEVGWSVGGVGDGVRVREGFGFGCAVWVEPEDGDGVVEVAAVGPALVEGVEGGIGDGFLVGVGVRVGEGVGVACTAGAIVGRTVPDDPSQTSATYAPAGRVSEPAPREE